jgi:hypothetical protein
MIYKNFELYNIAELIKAEGGGFYMSRLPSYIRDKMGRQGQNMAICTGGAEIRFVINSGKAEITLRYNNPGSATHALVYYGGVQAGYTTLKQVIFDSPTTLVIENPPDADKLKAISDASGYKYDTKVIRILLESNQTVLIDCKGDVRPPRPEEVPANRFMMYGSSITHGSLACSQNLTYLSQISRRIGYDYYSYGFAGSCLLEHEVADYISEQGNEINPRTWDFAILELGINAGSLSNEEFSERVDYLLNRMLEKNPGKKLFVIDIFYHSGDLFGSQKTNDMREIVRSACNARSGIVHIDGRSLLSSARGLSADFVHPNVDGVREIADKLGKIIEDYVKI